MARVAAWAFETGSGSTAYDEESGGHDLTITGASWNATGKFDNSLTYGGSTHKAAVADHADLKPTTAFTISAWIYPTSLTSWATIAAKENSTEFAFGIYAGGDTSDLPEAYVFLDSGSFQFNKVVSDTAIIVDTWVHVAGVYDGSTLKIYLDGVERGSTAETGNVDHTNASDFTVGNNSIWSDENFTGRIDDVRIYDHAQTGTEIAADMLVSVAGGGGVGAVSEQAVATDTPVGVASAEAAVTEGAQAADSSVGAVSAPGQALITEGASAGAAESAVATTSASLIELATAADSMFRTPAENLLYVRPGATGSADGSDWTNAFTAIPTTLLRGYTYHIADGSYSSLVCDDAVSGTDVITIKKATESDHGTSAGWQTSYGDGQATFPSVEFYTSYWVLDGTTRNENDWWDSSSYGISVGSSSTIAAVQFYPGNNVACEHIECRYVASEAKTNIGGPNEDPACFHMWMWLDPPATWAQAEGIVCHRTLAYGGTQGWMMRGSEGFIVEYSAAEYQVSNGTNHGNLVNFYYQADNGVVRYNKFRNIFTGGPTGTVGGGGTSIVSTDQYMENIQVYGNEVTGFDCGDGAVGFSTDYITSLKVYNNVFVDGTGWNAGVLGYDGGGDPWEVKNNIWINCSTVDIDGGGPAIKTHNAFWDNNARGTSNAQLNFSTSNFVDFDSADYRLANATDAGATLPSPYNEDLNGNIRGADGTWDRGTYEYVAFGANAGELTESTQAQSSETGVAVAAASVIEGAQAQSSETGVSVAVASVTDAAQAQSLETEVVVIAAATSVTEGAQAQSLETGVVVAAASIIEGAQAAVSSTATTVIAPGVTDVSVTTAQTSAYVNFTALSAAGTFYATAWTTATAPADPDAAAIIAAVGAADAVDSGAITEAGPDSVQLTGLNNTDIRYKVFAVWTDGTPGEIFSETFGAAESAIYSGSFGKSAGFTVIGDCITDAISDAISGAIN